MIREPAVAGMFYPASRSALESELKRLTPAASDRRGVLGVVAPHAGYAYSGSVAGALYGAIDVPDEVVILCPNHTGRGAPFALWPEGEWTTPLGNVPVSERLNEAIESSFDAVERDIHAHLQEHSAEVQLPFLQYRNPNVRIAVLCIASFSRRDREGERDILIRFGKALGRAFKADGQNVLIVASSDMTHYESEESAREKDRKAIECIEKLDESRLHDTIHRHGITMCGYAPAVAMVAAGKERGATDAELVKYTTSGEVSGDFDRVVGYAGLIVR